MRLVMEKRAQLPSNCRCPQCCLPGLWNDNERFVKSYLLIIPVTMLPVMEGIKTAMDIFSSRAGLMMWSMQQATTIVDQWNGRGPGRSRGSGRMCGGGCNDELIVADTHWLCCVEARQWWKWSRDWAVWIDATHTERPLVQVGFALRKFIFGKIAQDEVW